MSGSISTIILLTGELEAPVLTEMLRRSNHRLEVKAVHYANDLARICQDMPPQARLLSFCSSVIVPSAILEKLSGPAYNFHPGPPERPGRYPAVFALYDDARHFGVTVHEMRAAVDSGPIVTVERFEIPADCDLPALESTTLIKLAAVFLQLAPYMVTVARPLPHLPITWSGHKTTKAECDQLCAITTEMDSTEIARRRRCCGGLTFEAKS